MELTRDALLQVVKATRMTIRLAENTKRLLTYENGWTVVDEIAGLMSDVLFKISGETLSPWEDFGSDSATMKLLRSKGSDEEVANAFIQLHRKNSHCTQPNPHTMEQEDFDELVRRNGGYRKGQWRPVETPEGDWE